LKHLPWAAIDPLVKSLGELQHYKARRVVCSALSHLGQDHADLIARGLDDERWYVVRNLVIVLGRIGTSNILNYLKKTIKHEDYRVRKETINAAAKVTSGDNTDFMIMALSDPDVKIQMSSLKYLVENKVVRAFNPIENIIKDKKFRDRPPEQINKFLEAYALLGQDKALVLLKPLALKRMFLASAKDERLKIMAITALGKIRTTESVNILKKLAKAKKGKIASAAMKAQNILTKRAD
jgi:HEAT repeat protein